MGKILTFKRKREIKWWHWESLLVTFIQLTLPIFIEIGMFQGQKMAMIVIISLTLIFYIIFRRFFKLERRKKTRLTNEEKEDLSMKMHAYELKSYVLVAMVSVLFIIDALTSKSALIIKIFESIALPLFITLSFISRKKVNMRLKK